MYSVTDQTIFWNIGREAKTALEDYVKENSDYKKKMLQKICKVYMNMDFKLLFGHIID